MKFVVCPGSFNPLHWGHIDLLGQTEAAFAHIEDLKVVLAQGINPDKVNTESNSAKTSAIRAKNWAIENGFTYREFKGLFVEFIQKLQLEGEVIAVIRGLRNEQDFKFEEVQQYYNKEILGLDIPTLYILSDPKFKFLSSSGLREIDKLRWTQ